MKIKQFISERVIADRIIHIDDPSLLPAKQVRLNMLSLHKPKMSSTTVLFCNKCIKDWPCPPIVLVSKLYKDHPDYSEEWDDEEEEED